MGASWVGLVVILVAAPGVGWAAMSRGAGENAGPPPERIGSVYAEAEAAAHAGHCQEALRLVRHALSVDPTDAAAFNLRGYCLRKTGDLPGAFKAYENALKLRSRFPEAREYLAEAHVDAALA